MKRSGDRNLGRVALGREGMLSAHREWGERGLEGNPPTIHGALDTHFQFLIFHSQFSVTKIQRPDICVLVYSC